MAASISIAPRRGVSLTPKRGVQLAPGRRQLEEGPPLWFPSEIPGHKDYIPVLVMISGWRGVGKTLGMTMLGLIQKARYQRSSDRLWYSHRQGDGWCNTDKEETTLLELAMQRSLKGGTEFSPICEEHGVQLQRHENKWKLMANYPVIGADIVDPKLPDHLATFNPDMTNGTALIDELPSYFPNRKSLRGINVDFSTYIQQVRKRNVEIIFTAQVPIRVDVQITEQVDWYIIPERFGPRGNFLRLYWFDYKGQFVGQGHKYWPPKKEEADVVKVYGPLDSIYGKYPTGQIIAPQWSGHREAIIAQDEWDESQFVDGPPMGGMPMPEYTGSEHLPDLMNQAVIPPKSLEEFIAQLPSEIDVKKVITDVQHFFKKPVSHNYFRDILIEHGWQFQPDNHNKYKGFKP